MSMIQTKPSKNNARLNEAKSKILNAEPVKFNLNLPRHIHYKLKNKCAAEGTIMGNVVREMIIEYVNIKK